MSGQHRVGTIELERYYPHPPAKVWCALTDSEALADWLMTNDFRPEVGHEFQFRTKSAPGWRGVVDCKVLEIVECERLSYSWRGEEHHRPTTVTWTLEPKGEGTILRLEHTGFQGIGGWILRKMLSSGWTKMLGTGLPEAIARVDANGYASPPGGTAHRRARQPRG